MIHQATEYVTLIGSTPHKLDDLVNEYLREGWLLYGPLNVHHRYIQVMVRCDFKHEGGRVP